MPQIEKGKLSRDWLLCACLLCRGDTLWEMIQKILTAFRLAPNFMVLNLWVVIPLSHRGHLRPSENRYLQKLQL